MDRRTVLTRMAALPIALAALRSALAPARAVGDGHDFSPEWLRRYARGLAGRAYSPPRAPRSEALARLDYDAYQSIRYRKDRGIWARKDSPFQVRPFHLGLFYLTPVEIYEVASGQARPIAFDKDLFHYADADLGSRLPDGLGFAGFRVHHRANWGRDFCSFLGASYFRAVGGELQYGLSARGVAVDTARFGAEEFPLFRAFWLERPVPSQSHLRVHALLDGPSIAGAYEFVIRPGATTVMDIRATLYPRRELDGLGLAPLTSMYHHGENDQRNRDDFRPEVHDSDGLALWTGRGERIWRPLVNPEQPHVNAFQDDNPRGFGLLQRDRSFANYQDDGAYYNRRPNLWVEPLGAWGPGAVELVELPAADETFDNIVAYWRPRQPAGAGSDLALSYRLHWGSAIPDRLPGPAVVVATRIGRGGIPGQKQTFDSRKFVIDFVGGDLQLLDDGAAVEPVITAERGAIVAPAARPIHELRGWRVNFDLRDPGAGCNTLRCYLRLGGSALSETWLYTRTPRYLSSRL